MGSERLDVVVSRFDVFLVRLDPTEGREIRKTRPCLIISPDEMNQHIDTVIIAPMTTKGRPYPTRVSLRFKGKSGQVVLDQIRTVGQKPLGQACRNDHRCDAHASPDPAGRTLCPVSLHSSLTPWLADHWGWTTSLLVAALIAFCGGVMWLKINAAEGLRE
jgi:mRNA interferase MazF